LTGSKKQSDKEVILSEAKRSRRISWRYRRVTQRDGKPGLAVFEGCVAASTSLGITDSLEVGQSSRKNMAVNKAEIRTLIPHSGLMCLLDEVVQWDDQSIACVSNTHRDPANPLRR